ncbi:hypothetical protein D3C78_1830210 [compost metagenome]
MHPHKASINSASGVSLSRDINRNLFNDGCAAFLDYLDAVDVFSDDVIAHRAQLLALLEGFAQLVALDLYRVGSFVPGAK